MVFTNNEQLIVGLFNGVLHRSPKDNEMALWLERVNGNGDIEPLLQSLLDSKEFSNIQSKLSKLLFPPGHFYSPVVNVEEVRWFFENTRAHPPSLPAIQIDKAAMLGVWNGLLPYLRDIPFPEEPAQPYRYHFKNPAFSYGDGSILHAMLRRHRPKRLVEVGSGYSSACAVDTIDHYLGGQVDISFVEPHPALLVRLLGEDTEHRFRIHASTVQKADMKIFESLEDGDFLFIDSTHVMKTGSDVCHELFNILPALKPGVFIHFHDIFWPFEYGRKWVLEENRSWNEIYGLRAFLMYNDAFKVVFFNDYFVQHCRTEIDAEYPIMLKNGGGSIWLRKVR